jgi:hypothetical protein
VTELGTRHFVVRRFVSGRPRRGGPGLYLPEWISTPVRITLETRMCWRAGEDIAEKYIDLPRWRVVQVDSEGGRMA